MCKLMIISLKGFIYFILQDVYIWFIACMWVQLSPPPPPKKTFCFHPSKGFFRLRSIYVYICIHHTNICFIPCLDKSPINNEMQAYLNIYKKYHWKTYGQIWGGGAPPQWIMLWYTQCIIVKIHLSCIKLSIYVCYVTR